MNEAPSSEPPESMVIERPSAESPSLWQRFKARADNFSEHFLRDFFGYEPSLSSKLPPVLPLRRREVTLVSPGVTIEAEHGEKMLLALVQASPLYQRAVLEVARRALAARHDGKEAWFEFLAHYTLSRLRPDGNGRIEITRLREALPAVAFASELAPALIRLEEQGIVFLVLDTRDGDPMTQILRSKITHVELREPV